MRRLIRRQADQTLPGMSPLLGRLFAARGITDATEVDHSLSHLLPPTGLKGLQAAAELLGEAVIHNRKILIVGDFDADGATSCALLVLGLGAMGARQVDYLVPNRFEFGYGLTPEIVDVASTRNPALIVTVDNGISSVDGVRHARALGMDVLVTDHHLAGETLPEANAIVNPNQPGCEFASKHLAGVGVAFYLLSALRVALRAANWFRLCKLPEPNLADYLDLVALGTIADVVRLDRNNRILVSEGIRRIRGGRASVGLLALLEIAGRLPEEVLARDLAFAVAPRLNAAGRLEDMSLGIECLLTDDRAKAQEYAVRLDALNRERREIESDMKEQALAALAKAERVRGGDKTGLCLYEPDWHQGVVGIVAARVKDRYHRPVIAFANAGGGELKGSARSIAGFHIRDALDHIAACNPGLVTKFGGHAMAAGLTLAADRFQDFAVAFDEEAKRQLTPAELEHRVVSDGEPGERLTLALVREIENAAPWGQGFEEPLFDAEFEIVDQRIVGERHLKLKVRPLDDDVTFDAIAFNQDRLLEGRYRRLAYRPDINVYRGRSSVQLVVVATDLSPDN
ncbi:MAG: single-stranded-DNA-specific exonuclease RecJ [Pseudomonadota bacterium]